MAALRPVNAWLMSPRALWALWAVYLLPRLLVCLLPVEQQSDAEWYFERAVDLAAGRGYMEAGHATAFWPPGWPFALAAVFKVFGASNAVVAGFNIVTAVVAGLLTYLMAKRLTQSELVARWALLLLAVYPNAIGYVPFSWTEIFFSALFLLLTWLLLTGKSWVAQVLIGVVAGFGTLVKAQAIAFVVLFFAARWLVEGLSWASFKRQAPHLVLIIVVAAAVVAPWSLRNQRELGVLVPISTNGGLTLLTGNNPSARGDYTPDDPLVTSMERNVVNQVEVDREAKRRGQAWIAENPGRFVALMPLKFFRLWAPDGESEWWYQSGYGGYDAHQALFRAVRAGNQAFYVLALALFVYGCWKFRPTGLREGKGSMLFYLPVAVCLFPTLVCLVFSGQSRFHFVCMPFIFIVAGAVLAGHARGRTGDV